MVELTRPSWLTDAQNFHPRPNLMHLLLWDRTYTIPVRGVPLLDVMERRIIPEAPTPVRILEIGIGKNSLVVASPFEPYWIAALLEHQGIDYSMVLVDKNRNILNDVERRREIFAALSVSNTDTLLSWSWRKYLELTNQPRTITNHPEKELEFVRFGISFLRRPFLPWREIQEGILKASVPAGFTRRIHEKRILFKCSDIATADLEQFGEFDLIICMNTLYYLPTEGQKLAVFKMSRALSRNGRMLIGDIEDGWGGLQPLTAPFGGWLNEEKMADLGLSLEEKSPEDAPTAPYILLNKNR